MTTHCFPTDATGPHRTGGHGAAPHCTGDSDRLDGPDPASPVADPRSVDLDALGAHVRHVRENPIAGNRTYRASARWTGGLRAEATVRDHPPLTSDEPTYLGGDDTAPSPVEQLIAALANCVAAAYAANAAAIGLPLHGIEVDVEGELNLQAFLGLSRRHAGYERVRVSVHLDSPAPRELLEELHCGVTRTSRVGQTFTAPVPLDITLA